MSSIPTEVKLIHLIDSPFYSSFYETEVVVLEDETLWDVETHSILESILTDERINLLHSEAYPN